jgi:hypothetical protein
MAQLIQSKKISKKYALETLKKWADDDIVMVVKQGRHGVWTEDGLSPDGESLVGCLVKAAAKKKDEYYFDDNEFVKGDKTIMVVKVGVTTSKMFYAKLIELEII